MSAMSPPASSGPRWPARRRTAAPGLLVARARAFERAGATAIQIEDQGFPKKCGHLDNKVIVPLDASPPVTVAVAWRLSPATMLATPSASSSTAMTGGDSTMSDLPSNTSSPKDYGLIELVVVDGATGAVRLSVPGVNVTSVTTIPCPRLISAVAPIRSSFSASWRAPEGPASRS